MEDVEQSWRLADRRSLGLRGAAVGAGAIGVSRLLTAPPASASGGLTKGDVAILQFLAAAELLEADLWEQYNELGGVQDSERPGGTGNKAYTAALSVLDKDIRSTSTTTPRTSRATELHQRVSGGQRSGSHQPGQVPHRARQQGDRRSSDRPLDQPDGADHRHELVDALPQRRSCPKFSILFNLLRF